VCGDDPNKVAGYYRNGSCETGRPEDVGTHVVCAVVDEPFYNTPKVEETI